MSSNNDSRHKRIKVLCNTVRDDCRTSDEHIVSSLLSLCDRIATLKQEATMLDNETHQVIRERMRLFRESHWAYRNPTVPNSIKYLYDELQGNVPQVTGDPGSSIRNGHPATYARRVDALLQLTQNSYRTRNLEDFGYDEIGMPQGPKTSVAIGYRPVFPKEGALKVPDDVVENNYRSHDGKKKIKQNFADQSAEPNFDSKAFKSDHISHQNQKHTTSSSSCSPFATEKHCGRESTQKKTPSKKSVNSSHVQREIPKGSEFTPTTGTYSPAKKEDAAPTAPNALTSFKSVSGNSFGGFGKAPSAATPTLFGVTPTTGGESDTTVEPKKEDTAAAPTAPNSITGFKSVSGNSFGGFGKAPSAATPTLFGVTPTTGGESDTTVEPKKEDTAAAPTAPNSITGFKSVSGNSFGIFAKAPSAATPTLFGVTPTTGGESDTAVEPKKEDTAAAPTAPNSITGFKSVSGNSFGIFAKAPSAATPTLFGVTPTTGGESDTTVEPKKEDTAAAPTAPNALTSFKSVSGNSFGGFGKAPSAATPTLFGVTPTTGGESDTAVEPKKEDTAAAPTARMPLPVFKSVSGNSFGGFGKAPSAATPTLFGVTPTTGGESATTTTMQDNEVNHVASSSQQVPIASTLPSKTEEPKFDVESMSKATLPPATGVSSAFASFPSSTAAQTAFPQASNQSTFWQQPSTCGNPDASPGSNFPDNSQFPSSGVTPPVSGAGVCPSAGGSAPAAAQSAFGASTPAAAQSAFGASTPAAAQSAFGASTPAAAQSAFGASTPAAAQSAFGPSAPAAAQSAFGASTPAAAQSAFGASTPAAAQSAFGASTPAAAQSAFGASTPGAAQSAFGASTPATAQSAFGASAPAAAQSAFGASTPAAAQSAFGASTPAAAQSAFGASTPGAVHNEFFQQGVLPNNSVCGDSQSGFKVQGSFHAPTTYGVPPTGTIPQAPAGNGGWGKVGNVSAFGKNGGAEGGATKSAFGNLSRPAPAAATGFVSAFGNM